MKLVCTFTAFVVQKLLKLKTELSLLENLHIYMDEYNLQVTMATT